MKHILIPSDNKTILVKKKHKIRVLSTQVSYKPYKKIYGKKDKRYYVISIQNILILFF